MDETNVVKLFLVIGVFALLLNVYSITLTDGFMVKMFTDFVVPMMCIEENGTYYLSMPTNSSDFCDNILDESVDSDEMVSLCADSYAQDEEKYESCVQMVGFYDKRVDDCMSYMFSLGKNQTVSVLPEEVEGCCSVLVDAPPDLESPTGLLMQELFRGIKDHRIKG